MSLPSDKYKKQLLPIKQQLMKEITSYFTYAEFHMSGKTVINFPIEFGEEFRCEFDTIHGFEDHFRLYMNERDFMTLISFDASDDKEVERDIPFLMKLLDYVDVDYRNRNHGKRPGEK
jgi:hypothetical protein